MFFGLYEWYFEEIYSFDIVVTKSHISAHHKKSNSCSAKWPKLGLHGFQP